ncbi:MAG: tRNA preQ1(34) S-adenosylmethionine ribosyltransferase-isomerase QueA [Luteimonas sp.]|nr:tRNA preQ1(34) S-adenosylmethionine ribosyltransferase-isomerase QueA [Luteimonas sp.]
MRLDDFHSDLPPELIAQAPAATRGASRLLHLDGATGALRDGLFPDIVELLDPGDLLVINDTRVIKARLPGRKASGGRVEVLVERVTGLHEADVQLRASHAPKAGSLLQLGGSVEAEVLGRSGDLYRLRFAGNDDVWTLLGRHGRVPLPPYIGHAPDAGDEVRYQTIYARNPGAVAAPTAGLHFDDALLASLRERGVQSGHVTLHVGAGTFQPVRVDDLREHAMHSEWLNVGAELVAQVRRTREAGGRVIAVGTTVVRALESAMHEGELHPFAGETRIFIFPGYRIRSVDALLTNFHLPESTLLMLVSAFAGKDRIFQAYAHAVRARYRFFSYGDAMLLFPPPGP